MKKRDAGTGREGKGGERERQRHLPTRAAAHTASSRTARHTVGCRRDRPQEEVLGVAKLSLRRPRTACTGQRGQRA
eukprot:1740397-Rhodomonas_salina.1